MMSFSLKVSGLLCALLLPFFACAQINSNGSNANAIQTAIPSLTISPDSRSGGLGEAGVALSPDANANYWNPSKLAFIQDDDEVSISYNPWLRNLVPDISLSYLSYAHKIDDRNSIGLFLQYFNVGNVALTDESGNSLGIFAPSDFSVGGSFARSFGQDFSLGLTVRYIHSILSNTPGSADGNAIAADVSYYYKKSLQEGSTDALFAFGVDISNIGSKISYTTTGPSYYLPTNLKVGAANTWNFDADNQLTATLDLNKYLVPSNPNSTVSVPAGIFQSFSDVSAGTEFKEIYYSTGFEYTYNKLFSLRAGYYYESPDFGGRHYVTLGFGLKYQDLGFDFAYIAANQQNSPLANTLRFTLLYNFGGKSTK